MNKKIRVPNLLKGKRKDPNKITAGVYAPNKSDYFHPLATGS